MFILLVISIIFLTFISFIATGRNIFSPSFLVCISFFVSSMFALGNYDKWGLSNFNTKTYIIICVGLFLFIASDLFYQIYPFKVYSEHAYKIDIKIWKTIFVIVYQLVVLLAIFLQVKRIGSGGMTDNITYNYRMMVSYGGISTSGFISMMTTISLAISYLYSFELIVNFKNNSLFKNILECLPVFIYITVGLISGQRFDMIKIVTFIVIVYSMFYLKRKVKIRTIMKLLLVSFLFLLAFYLLKTIAGREGDEGLLTYLSLYVGGSLKLFDLYITNNDIKNQIFGQESLYSINRLLIRFGIVDFQQYAPHLEFRSFNGIALGNVYTGFRRLIQDFGLVIGMLGVFITSQIYSSLYYKLKASLSIKNPLRIGVLYYGMMSYPLITYSINDYFFQGIISANFLLLLIFVFLGSKMLFFVNKGEVNVK